VGTRVFLDDSRQELNAGSRHASNGDIAATGLAGFSDFGERVGQLTHQPFRLRQEVASDGRECDAARRAFNQLDAQMGFEILQAPRHGGLRNMQLLGRALKAGVFGDRNKGLNAQRIHFHDVYSLIAAINSFYSLTVRAQNPQREYRIIDLGECLDRLLDSGVRGDALDHDRRDRQAVLAGPELMASES
jgi:hypothetical protein